MALERSAHLLRLFVAHADGDGLIGAANDLAAATADLLEPEPLLRLTVLPERLRCQRSPTKTESYACLLSRPILCLHC